MSSATRARVSRASTCHPTPIACSVVADHCLRSVNYVNVIVADKQPHLQYLDMEAAIDHCTKGAGIWDWASNDQGVEPDVVMASCGDFPTRKHWRPRPFSAKICPTSRSGSSMWWICSGWFRTPSIPTG